MVCFEADASGWLSVVVLVVLNAKLGFVDPKADPDEEKLENPAKPLKAPPDLPSSYKQKAKRLHEVALIWKVNVDFKGT